MVISHNMQAENANRQLGTIVTDLSKNAEKLSSGYRINRSADDAAGLSISEKMRSQIRGLNRSSENAQDGIAYIQTAEGALDEVHKILQRGRELSVQAANDTNVEEDRQSIQDEIDAINKEIDRIAKDTEYNDLKLFDSKNATSSDEVAAKQVGYRMVDGKLEPIKLNVQATDWASAAATIGVSAAALQTYAQKLRDNYVPSILNKMESTVFSGISPDVPGGMNIGLKFYNNNDSSLAYVSSNGSGYELGINLKYLQKDGSGQVKTDDDLMTTIAHEMTHAVMFDCVTNGMLGVDGADSFPSWFIEGTAQAVGGAMNYLMGAQNSSSQYNPTTHPEGFKKLMAGLNDGNSYTPYCQGYLASMYLGQVASGSATVSADNIAKGLNNILKDVADGYSLGQAINKNTNGKYYDLADFEDGCASNDMVNFAKDLFAATGSGTGSVITHDLSKSKADIIAGGGSGSYFHLVVDGPSFINNHGSHYEGGGATKTSGKKEDGSTNPDAKSSWGGANGSGQAQAAGTIILQVGAKQGQTISIDRYKLSAKDLSVGGVSVASHKDASISITRYDKAIKMVSDIRSKYGAVQNRLEHTVANLDNASENTQAAESRIRDTEIAEVMVQYSKNNILTQAGQSMLAQANQSKQGVLSLLQ